MVLEKVDIKVDQAVEKMGGLEAWVENLAGMVMMLRNMVLQMNQCQDMIFLIFYFDQFHAPSLNTSLSLC